MNYQLTLCEPDGSLVAVMPDIPVLPRFLYVTPASIQLGDHLDDKADDLTTVYARVASSVWIEDGAATALFIRVVDDVE